MNEVDRDFLFLLERCESKYEILKVINDIDDDDIEKKMRENYEQILEFNQNETEKNIIKILEYKYRRLFE